MRLLIAAALALSASSPDQFDLICNGNHGTVRYRVDLAAGEWCWEQCGGTIKIAAVTSTRITFMDKRGASAFVDRVTGEWWQSSVDRFGSAFNHGVCTPAAFTGFGEQARKF